MASKPTEPQATDEETAQTKPVRRARKPKATEEREVEVSVEEKTEEVVDEAEVDVVENEVEVEGVAEVETPGSEAAEEPETVEPDVKVSKPKFSFWQRLFGSGKPVIESEPQIAVPALTKDEIEAQIAENEKRLIAAQAQHEALEKENYDKQILIEENQLRVDEIQNFISSVERSYIWRVQQIMDSMMSKAQADLLEFENAVNNVEAPEEGRLLALRKSFHKAVATAIAITGGISAFSIFYPIVYKLQWPTWLLNFVNSDFFTSLLVALGVLGAGVIYLIRRNGGKEKMSTRKIIIFSVIAVLFYALVASWPNIEPTISQRLIPFLRENIWQILTGCGSAFVFVLVVALVIYYQGWSIFRRDVTEQLARLNNVIEGYVHTKQEIGRLTNLHRQASDWLKILAHALFRPWKTHPDWDGTREYEKHFSTFPFALRVAQAQEEKDSHMAELERLVGARLLVQGWRSSAFADLVKFAGEEIGLQDGKFNLETLDTDLPHQTNNSRALLLKYLEHSADTHSAGELDLQPIKVDEEGKSELQPSDRYLVEVARDRLLELVEKTQSIVLSQARPRVAPIKDDPLLEIREDQGGIEEYDPTSSWDDFLRESLGTDEVAQPPMGILNFSEKGQVNRVQEKPSSYIITPRRLADALPSISSSTVRLVPVGDDKARAVEIIARVDVVGPLSFDEIAVLSDGSVASVAPDVEVGWDDEEL